MRLARLHLQAFGPFTERWLDFGPPGRLVLVHGPNEAGKSSTLRAITDLRFGIPQQSRDNFVHPHPEMRIGAVFVDRDGREHAVVRRKGRGPTLLDAVTGAPVPPGLEAALSGGLSRDEYERMFGLDHARLRDGGRELLEGRGDIGAALFEASAGVRSLPRVVERLDQDARRFFMPGTRGRNARINEALAAWKAHEQRYREALVRPAHWAELFRRHREAAEALAELEKEHARLQADRLLAGELRAVAPLLSTLDHARQALQALGSTALLPEDAETARAQAQAGLTEARRQAAQAGADAERAAQALAAIAVDAQALQAAPLVRALSAALPAYERARAERAQAGAQLAEERARTVAIATALSADEPLEALLARAPGPAERATLERWLRLAEAARQSLEAHRESLRRTSALASSEALLPLPGAQARDDLRAALAAFERGDALRRRLAALPVEIRAAERTLAGALETLGDAGRDGMPAAHPLLDAAIDDAIARERDNATRREERSQRIEQVESARRLAAAQLDELLAQGEVPTADAVREARARRDAIWQQLRASPSPPPGLPEGYEAAVQLADRLADALASDSERAARLQSARRTLDGLEHDRDVLAAELQQLQAEDRRRADAWRQALAEAQLPPLSPAALREWQAQLQQAKRAAEHLASLQDERARADEALRTLCGLLGDALRASGLAAPAGDLPADALGALARHAEAELRAREAAHGAAAGSRTAFERQQAQMRLQEQELGAALREATDALAPALGHLGLPPGAPIESIRARLDEFDALLAAQARCAAAAARQQHANAALSTIEDDAQRLSALLGEPAESDPRLLAARASARLALAEDARQARALAQQAIEAARAQQRAHEESAARHVQTLQRLCEAAGVGTPEQLPEAEERSRRRRALQAAIDQADAQLAQASRRPAGELRALLAARDPLRLDADERACEDALAALDTRLPEARAHEEAARHALMAIDASDTAAAEREAMEGQAAAIRAALPPWSRARLAHALLSEALARFREHAQAPMLRAASAHFVRMTDGEFQRLLEDESAERPVLLAQRRDGSRVGVDGLSEGTRDQLYLALRLAAIELRRAAGTDLPLVLDDVLMSSDDVRAARMLSALAAFGREGQVLVFTHHRHLVEVARASLGEALTVVALERMPGADATVPDAAAAMHQSPADGGETAEDARP